VIGTQEGIRFNNTGTVESPAEHWSLASTYGGSSGSSTNGTFIIGSGSRLRFAGSMFDLNGNNSVAGGGTMELATGYIECHQLPRPVSPGRATWKVTAGKFGRTSGSTLNINLTKVALSSGYFGGQGTINSTSGFEWTGGYLTSAGGFYTSGNGTISGTGSKGFSDSAKLYNSGTIVHQGDAIITMDEATLYNQAGGVYDLQGDGQIMGVSIDNYHNDTADIYNAGTFRKSGGTGKSVIGTQEGIRFNNTGTVEVTSGTLEFGSTYGGSSGSSTNGTFIIGSGSRLRFAGSMFDLTATTVSQVAEQWSLRRGISECHQIPRPVSPGRAT